MAKQFIGPFLVTFSIAMFVLVMQALWQYLERIAGKGLSFFTVMELLSYKCVGLVPLALPLGLLISSVMVLGGMAEHYELASIKSTGTSLLRTMFPLILFGFLSAGASFLISDYVIPAANLQFGARMYDINQKKPTLNMEQGLFNTDFNQFAIRLGERDVDGRHIGDVLIYDHTRATTGNLGQITAKKGEMYSANQGDDLVMELSDGVQYSEQKPTGKNRSSLPFVRTYFDKYTKIFDLTEFKLGVTQTSLFETNRSMLATFQLQEGVDSISLDIAIRKQTISNHTTSYLPLLTKDSVVYRVSSKPVFIGDDDPSGRPIESREEDPEMGETSSIVDTQDIDIDKAVSTEQTTQQLARAEENLARNIAKAQETTIVSTAANWPGLEVLLDSVKQESRQRIFNRARSGVRSIVSQASSTNRILPGIYESRVKYIYDKHMKYSMAVVCIIFIFIGAPMGAIVRKGGFGYPILISIIFFVIFVILTIFCRKLAESFVVDGAFAGWLPCVLLFPMSLYITSRAMKDAKLVNVDGISQLARKFVGRIGEKGAAAGAE